MGAVADKPSATSHDHENTATPVTPASSSPVRVELLGNYCHLTPGWTLLKYWTPPDSTSQEHKSRIRFSTDRQDRPTSALPSCLSTLQDSTDSSSPWPRCHQAQLDT